MSITTYYYGRVFRYVVLYSIIFVLIEDTFIYLREILK